MANPFDEFDSVATQQNPFDEFDAPKASNPFDEFDAVPSPAPQLPKPETSKAVDPFAVRSRPEPSPKLNYVPTESIGPSGTEIEAQKAALARGEPVGFTDTLDFRNASAPVSTQPEPMTLEQAAKYTAATRDARAAALRRVQTGDVTPRTSELVPKIGTVGGSTLQSVLAEERVLRNLPPDEGAIDTSKLGHDVTLIEHLADKLSAPTAQAMADIQGIVDPSASAARTAFIQQSTAGQPAYRDSFWLTTVPQALGSTAPIMMAGAINPAAGFAVATGQGAGSARREAYQAGASDATQVAAAIGGALLGASEALPLQRMLGRGGSGFVSRLIRGGLEEGLQEVGQTLGSNALAKALYDESRQLTEGVTEGGAAGFVVGSFLGGLAGKVERGEVTAQQAVSTVSQAASVLREAIKNDPAAAQQLFDAARASGDTEVVDALTEIIGVPAAPQKKFTPVVQSQKQTSVFTPTTTPELGRKERPIYPTELGVAQAPASDGTIPLGEQAYGAEQTGIPLARTEPEAYPVGNPPVTAPQPAIGVEPDIAPYEVGENVNAELTGIPVPRKDVAPYPIGGEPEAGGTTAPLPPPAPQGAPSATTPSVQEVAAKIPKGERKASTVKEAVAQVAPQAAPPQPPVQTPQEPAPQPTPKKAKKVVAKDVDTRTGEQVQQQASAAQDIRDEMARQREAADRPQKIEQAQVWARSRGTRFNMAVMSFVSGRWDDVVGDVRDGRMTADDAKEVVGQLESRGLMAQSVANDMRKKFDAIPQAKKVVAPVAPRPGEASAPKEEVAQKEPWQMTEDEYVSSGLAEGGITEKHQSRIASGLMRDDHYEFVRDAVSEGKPVPSEVLADYPDLAAKYAKEEVAQEVPIATQPWEGSKVEDEGKWFGTKVTVMPQMKGDTGFKGTVTRVLNGGRLVEVRPEGGDGSFRVDSEFVKVDELAEQAPKVKPVEAAPSTSAGKPFLTAGDLAEHYKATGLNRAMAWDQYVIDTILSPRVRTEPVNAKEFFEAFDRIPAGTARPNPKMATAPQPLSPNAETQPKSETAPLQKGDKVLYKGKEAEVAYVPEDATKTISIRQGGRVFNTDRKNVTKQASEPAAPQPSPTTKTTTEIKREKATGVEVEAPPRKLPSKPSEPWMLSSDEYVAQKESSAIDGGVDASEIDDMQRASWRQQWVKDVMASPRDADIPASVLASMPESSRESLLKTHAKAQENWMRDAVGVKAMAPVERSPDFTETWDEFRRGDFAMVTRKVSPGEYKEAKRRWMDKVLKAIRDGSMLSDEVMRQYVDSGGYVPETTKTTTTKETPNASNVESATKVHGDVQPRQVNQEKVSPKEGGEEVRVNTGEGTAEVREGDDVKKPLELTIPSYRDWRWNQHARNSGAIVPNKVGVKFTADQMDVLRKWAKENGLTVMKTSPTAIEIVGPPTSGLHLSSFGAVGVKSEASYAAADKRASDQKAANEALEAKAKARTSAKWIVDTFGEGVVNPHNSNALSDFLEGVTSKFTGLASRQWKAGIDKIGALDAKGTGIDFAKVKAAYEAATKQATNQATPEPAPREGDDVVVYDSHADTKAKYDIYKANIKDRGVVYAVRISDHPRGGGDTFFPTIKEAVAEVAFQKKMEANREAWQARVDAEQAAFEASRGERENIDGFDAGMTAFKRGQVLAQLQKNVAYKGKVVSARDMVRKAIADGATVGNESWSQPLTPKRTSELRGDLGMARKKLFDVRGDAAKRDQYQKEVDAIQKSLELGSERVTEKVLKNTDGTFYDAKTIGKTAINYAEYLLSKPTAKAVAPAAAAEATLTAPPKEDVVAQPPAKESFVDMAKRKHDEATNPFGPDVKPLGSGPNVRAMFWKAAEYAGRAINAGVKGVAQATKWATDHYKQRQAQKLEVELAQKDFERFRSNVVKLLKAAVQTDRSFSENAMFKTLETLVGEKIVAPAVKAAKQEAAKVATEKAKKESKYEYRQQLEVLRLRAKAKGATEQGIREEVVRLAKEHLPPSIRGKMLNFVARTTTMARLSKAINYMRGRLAEFDAKQAVESIQRVASAKEMRNNKDIRQMLELARAKAKSMRRSGVDTDARVAISGEVEDIMRDAQALLHDAKRANEIYAEGKAQEADAYRKGILETIKKHPVLKTEGADSSRANRGVFGRLNDRFTRGSTFYEKLGGKNAYTVMFDEAVKAEDNEARMLRDLNDAKHAAAKAAGYQNVLAADADISGSLGQATQKYVTVATPLGDKTKIPLGQALKIAMSDPATKAMYDAEVQLAWDESHNKSFTLTPEIRSAIEDAVMRDHKKAYDYLRGVQKWSNEVLFPQAQEVHKKIKGYEMGDVSEYLPRKAERGPSTGPTMWTQMMRFHQENAGYTNKREVPKKIIIDDANAAVSNHAAALIKLINFAELTRSAEMVMNDPSVREQVASRYGEDAVKRIENDVANMSHGMDPTLDLQTAFERFMGALKRRTAGAAVALNPISWAKNMVGGIVKMAGAFDNVSDHAAGMKAAMYHAAHPGKSMKRMATDVPMLWRRYALAPHTLATAQVWGREPYLFEGTAEELRSAMKALARSVAKMNIRDIGDNLARAWDSIRISNFFDAFSAAYAYGAAESKVSREQPSLSGQAKSDAIAHEVSIAMRTTQNSHSKTDIPPVLQDARSRPLLGLYFVFMSDKLQTYNMLKSGSKMAVGAALVSAILSSLIDTGREEWRKKEDDDSPLLKRYALNLASELAGTIPNLDKLVRIVEDLANERTDYTNIIDRITDPVAITETKGFLRGLYEVASALTREDKSPTQGKTVAEKVRGGIGKTLIHGSSLLGAPIGPMARLFEPLFRQEKVVKSAAEKRIDSRLNRIQNLGKNLEKRLERQ